MRQVVLDTETTGLEPGQGHRIIELGCVELIDRRLTDHRFHQYICPDRDIDFGAEEVHGISEEFLRDKPRFAAVIAEFIAFVRDAEVIIHNAPFDVGFIDYELSLIEGTWGCFRDYCTVIDSLALARDRHPGQRNSLDALCSRYDVDNSRRELHGALLDAEILADVYLAMTGGQASLELSAAPVGIGADSARRHRSERPALRVIYASDDELAVHRARLDAIDEASAGKCVWKQLELESG